MYHDLKITKRKKDKSQRATVEKVLDENTLRVIRKLNARGLVRDISGCFGTGKEANVYGASVNPELYSKYTRRVSRTQCSDPPPIQKGGNDRSVRVVVKIYQTSIMKFRAREKYIENEMRFRTFCKSNPRKLVKLWAEKEVRNLRRMNNAGIPSPVPLYLKRNVMIMTMIGNPAPRMKDADVPDANSAYRDTLAIVYDMYNSAGLVHGDLSEYNLLYDAGRVYVIDVGQSVERSRGSTMLISDILNINRFFKRIGADVASVNSIFTWVTGLHIPACLNGITLNEKVFIPDRLNDITDKLDVKNFTAGPLPDGKPSIGDPHDRSEWLRSIRGGSTRVRKGGRQLEAKSSECGSVERKAVVRRKMLKAERRRVLRENKLIVKRENKIRRAIKSQRRARKC